MEDAYEGQDYAYASLISHCKQNAMRCQICKNFLKKYTSKMVLKL